MFGFLEDEAEQCLESFCVFCLVVFLVDLKPWANLPWLQKVFGALC